MARQSLLRCRTTRAKQTPGSSRIELHPATPLPVSRGELIQRLGTADPPPVLDTSSETESMQIEPGVIPRSDPNPEPVTISPAEAADFVMPASYWMPHGDNSAGQPEIGIPNDSGTAPRISALRLNEYDGLPRPSRMTRIRTRDRLERPSYTGRSSRFIQIGPPLPGR